jgi:hypothetical protein
MTFPARPQNGNPPDFYATIVAMAKWKPSTGAPTNIVQNGIMYSARGNNSLSMNLANNNLATGKGTASRATFGTSALFQNMDALIRSLDALYDIAADKPAWELYNAGGTADWALCANCAPDKGAKKLFRQYNFNRSLIGLGTVLTPVDLTQGFGFYRPIYFANAGAWPPIETSINVNLVQYPSYTVLQAGLGLGNPIYRNLGQTGDNIFTDDPFLTAYAEFPPFSTLPVCCFDLNGCPYNDREMPWAGH